MRGSKVASVLVVLAICSGTRQQELFGTDWVRRLVGNINANVQRDVQQLNQQVQQEVQGQLANIEKLKQTLNKTIAEDVANVGQKGDTIILNGGAGTSRIINSGYTEDGEPFHRDIESKVVGHVLHYTERIYDFKTKTFNTTGYTLDLSDPKATPVPLKNS